jgi:dTDP-4-dehydrorhamnose reductase
MRILVTGANGLLGSRLVRVLLSQGHIVLATGRGALRAQFGNAAFESVDLSDRNQLLTSCERFRPEVIVNTAGMTDVDGCERDPQGAYAANVLGVVTLCEGAVKNQAHLVHVSTDYVFDGERGNYGVHDLPNPQGVYALTKHLGEQTIKALMPRDTWTIARTAVVFGWPSAGKPNFGSWLLQTLRQQKPVKLFTDQHVSPSSAVNVAAMLAELATRRLSGIFHTAGAEAVNRLQFGERLCRHFGLDASLLEPSMLATAKLLSPRPKLSSLDVSLTASTLNAQPLSLDQSLELFKQECEGA